MVTMSSEKIIKFMELAIGQAQKASKAQEVPVGAILIDTDGNIIARAHNCPISSQDPTAHAEIVAIREAAEKINNYRLSGTTMFVTLEPCLMCAGALVWARVEKLFFGASDPKSGAFGSVIDINRLPGINHRIKAVGGILEEKCAFILKEFFQKRR